MSCVPPNQVALLKKFVEMCKANPNILHQPDIEFFKKYLESLGAVIPPAKEFEEMPQAASEQGKAEEEPPQMETEEAVESESESEESDVEFDDKDVGVDDDHEPPEYGDENIVLTDEMVEKADEKRGEAMTAVSDGDVENGIKLITEAIKSNPVSASLYAKRASYFLKIKKMNKAIHDCSKAMDLNPDSAQPYKWRGKAYMMLGKWEDSYHDLTMACKLDYDDDANEMLHDVKPNAMKIIEHKRKYERKREEKEINDRKERVKKAKEQHEKQRKEGSGSSPFETGDFTRAGGFPGGAGGFPGGAGGFPGGAGGFPGGAGGFPGGAGGFPGGAGGFPGGAGGPGAGQMPDISSLLSDPEVLEAFQDPEVAAAFQDVSQNPANITKYQDNPKIQSVINKMAHKFGGGPEK